ncbi:hypothetical protein Baya_12142 [Bagarius yarrelli]|uniref:Uncharacterized protein n=1 Tax=Bagarius yarrelli TaxID=175774 RepID=A0A556V376_BAGYA|nr:hypothetical protein Baya_12142 [Bagarius yarrelli]
MRQHALAQRCYAARWLLSSGGTLGDRECENLNARTTESLQALLAQILGPLPSTWEVAYSEATGTELLIETLMAQQKWVTGTTLFLHTLSSRPYSYAKKERRNTVSYRTNANQKRA